MPQLCGIFILTNTRLCDTILMHFNCFHMMELMNYEKTHLFTVSCFLYPFTYDRLY